ncbi:MAG TPA: TetR/AcrR family transcriptional regulator [Niabella sp.]|nr:TetR/AcrR family transcriptional regulator [Niabella sp.]
MARKITNGAIYNKERTKQKCLDAVGKILRTEGFEALNISNIAKAAGVDRKLIYVYFDSLDNLIATYIKNNDYWQSFSDSLQELLTINKKDFGQQIAAFIPQLQFEHLLNSREVQKIILWDLSEKNKILKETSLKREKILSSIFQISDPLFNNTEIDFRAIQALIIGGIYYLILQSVSNGSPFCGIDINKNPDKIRINKAIEYLMNIVYTDGRQRSLKSSKK